MKVHSLLSNAGRNAESPMVLAAGSTVHTITADGKFAKGAVVVLVSLDGDNFYELREAILSSPGADTFSFYGRAYKVRVKGGGKATSINCSGT